ncbi:unnamed protein product [Pleuronectes platessa]|uniref:Uncharacterized protein n=1 Tax=Pleuronectes platessa TaxID=8262 RepID=A0A9N7Z5H9_PLEPL|nr:unnamed protein product [Pleuronectes platessa]
MANARPEKAPADDSQPCSFRHSKRGNESMNECGCLLQHMPKAQVSGWGACDEGVQRPAQGIQTITEVAGLACLRGGFLLWQAQRCQLGSYHMISFRKEPTGYQL